MLLSTGDHGQPYSAPVEIATTYYVVMEVRCTGRSVFDLSMCVRTGDLSGAGGRGKTKTKNKGGLGAQGLQTAPRRGPKGEFWGILGNLWDSLGILENHAWWPTCMVDHMHVVHAWWWTIDGSQVQFSKKVLISGLRRNTARATPCIHLVE